MHLTASIVQIPQTDPDNRNDPQNRLIGRLGIEVEGRVVIYTAAAMMRKNDTASLLQACQLRRLWCTAPQTLPDVWGPLRAATRASAPQPADGDGGGLCRIY